VNVKLILASGSPRRKKLLSLLGVDFECQSSDVSEVKLDTPYETATENATRKALVVSEKFPDSLIMAADTIVDVDNVQVGKPADESDAGRILRMLSGKEHRVTTCVAIVKDGKPPKTAVCETQVKFAKLTDDIIKQYVSSVDVSDKAGAYGIQDHGWMLVECVKGDFSNVMGLPLTATMRLLRLAHEDGLI